MNTTYLNIPSTWPLTQAEAYREAIARFGVNRPEARYDYAGIAWQGNHGSKRYADWSQLPAARR